MSGQLRMTDLGGRGMTGHGMLPRQDGKGRVEPATVDWPLRSHLELAAFPSAVPCARLHARLVVWEWGPVLAAARRATTTGWRPGALRCSWPVTGANCSFRCGMTIRILRSRQVRMRTPRAVAGYSWWRHSARTGAGTCQRALTRGSGSGERSLSRERASRHWVSVIVRFGDGEGQRG